MIQKIKFKDEFHEPIINMAKTQTMRMPQSRIDVIPGDKAVAVFENKQDLLLKITDVGYKAFKSINDDDAKREGFSSASELKEALLDIYSEYHVQELSRFYFYKFEYLGVRL